MKFDGAVVSLIYACTVPELAIDEYLRPKFRFLSDNESLWRLITKGMHNKNERVVGFLKGIGQLRISVKENWWSTIKSFQDIPKLGNYPISVPMIPTYATSKSPITLSFDDKSYLASLVVSLYPVYTFAIRITIAMREEISAVELIHFLRMLKSEKYSVVFKKKTFPDVLNFSAFVKRKVISSIFSEYIAKEVNPSLSSMNVVAHLKGTSLVKDPKVFAGILLQKQNYDDINASILSEALKHQLSFYKSDTIVAYKSGIVAYTPYLYVSKSDLQRKRFRRKLYYAVEIGYSVKRFFKNINNVLDIVIKESPINLYDAISRLFITASPRILSGYKSDFGMLKPQSLQKFFKNIAFALELFRMHWRALDSVKDTLAKVITPDIVEFYEKCKRLNNQLLNEIIRDIYDASEIKITPQRVREIESVFPQQYRQVIAKIFNYLIHEFKEDMRKWNIKRLRTNLGWRRISKIAKDTNIEINLFYENAPKGLAGLVKLLEIYGFIETRTVPSRGKHGSAVEIRINPQHPVINMFLPSI